MTDLRLPLDSPQWDSSPSMRKANEMLQPILQSETPSAEAIEYFIYEFEGCDEYEKGYYFALPYLTEYLLEHKEALIGVLSDFCNPLMPANTISPECKFQIRLVRDQVADLMLFALRQKSSRTEFSYDGDCQIFIAGIAAVYMEAYVARQIAMPE